MHSSRRTHVSNTSAPSFNSSDLFNGAFTNTPLSAPVHHHPVSFTNDSFSIPTTNGQIQDPFDTSHVNQILTDKNASNGIQEPFMTIADSAMPETTISQPVALIKQQSKC